MSVLCVSNGKGGTGKCVGPDTLVVDPVSGVPRRVAEAVCDPSFTRVATWDAENRAINTAEVTAHIDSGVRSTLRIMTASGRSIDVTHHHPLLLPDGWRRADEVSVGETVALPGRMPEPLMPACMADELVDLLAILVAEGNTTTPTTAFTTTDPEIVRRAADGAGLLGARVGRTSGSPLQFAVYGGVPRAFPEGSCRCGCGEQTRLVMVKNRPAGYAPGDYLKFRPHHGPHPATLKQAFRVEHGLDGILAKHKSMPKAVWGLPTAQVGRFLGVLWMCDGTVSGTGETTIGFASERLTRDVQSLLLRLGVQSGVRYSPATYNGKRFPAWRLTVFSAWLPRFAGQVPLWGRKHDRLQSRLTSGVTPNGNVGAPSWPAALRKAMKAHVRPGNPNGSDRPTLQKVSRQLGWAMEGVARPRFETLLSNPRANGRRHLSPKALATFIDVFELDDEFGWLLSEDLFWDPVVSVEPAGRQRVFDLTVPSTSCFVANDMIVHNTSVASEIAACSALSGFQTLLVDLDPQVNVTANLRLEPGSAGTGVPLSGAMLGYGAAPLAKDVRPHLDVLIGDKRLTGWAVQANLLRQQGEEPERALVRILAPLADTYDLIVIDCPPLIEELNICAMVASDFVISPVKADRNSLEGLERTAERFTIARRINDQTQFLGVVLIDIALNAASIQREVSAAVAELVGDGMMLSTKVRSSDRAAWDTRQRGMFYAEYETAAVNAPRWYEQNADGVPAVRYASAAAASGVASDWAALTEEVFRRMSGEPELVDEQPAIADAGDEL